MTTEPVAVAVLDGTGDRGSVSLYKVVHGVMQRLCCNDSMFDSLGAFYSVISSTQGGWTWLSSEGRYMGAAAWGDMNRDSNPYYARLKQVLQLDPDGGVRLNRAMGNWYCDPFDRALQAGADRYPRRTVETRPALESRRDAAGRGYRSTGPTPRTGLTRPLRRNWCSRMR